MNSGARMRVLVVKNFEQFQHYKDRRPPWIKLYNDLLEDYAFLSLPDAARSHLMLLWLLASRHGNRIPFDPKYIARAIQCTSRIDFDALTASGLVTVMDAEPVAGRTQDASTPLARRKQNALPETETETETEPPNPPVADATDTESKADGPPHEPPGFAEAMAAYPPRSGSNPRREAARAYRARLGAGDDPAMIRAGVERYAAWCRDTGKLKTEYVMQARTFFGPERHYAEPWAAPVAPDGFDAEAFLREQREREASDAAWLERRRAERAEEPEGVAP